ncbi:MAG: hypothetical protein A2341_16415 [Deltaproteobacteria bacterium RIFOXYB12_FULL_58_9]|nr:MAG: hypothetical protein A2341_16415 [Deltaproteobacteria bacterium RIFOXYB12_FULL_58_9]
MVDFILKGPPGLFRCMAANVFIELGAVEGKRWSGDDLTTDALCYEDEWIEAPLVKYLAAIAQWFFDGFDPVNFGAILAKRVSSGTHHVLVQEIENDTVVINEATENLAMAIGLVDLQTASIAGDGGENGLYPSPTPLAISGDSGWLLYRTIEEDVSGLPDNTYYHTVVYQVGGDTGFTFAARQLQTDAVAFLATHLLTPP